MNPVKNILLPIALAFSTVQPANAMRINQLSELDQKFVEALRQKDENTAQQLLNMGANPNASNGHESALYLAALAGYKDITNLLIEQGAQVDAMHCGRTALMNAAERHNKHACELLIGAGANVRLASQNLAGQNSYTALTLLLSGGWHADSSTVQLLISAGADVNYTDYRGKSVLMDAVGNPNQNITHLLLASGANINQADEEGRTALHHYPKEESLKLLIAAGANVNHIDIHGESALHAVHYPKHAFLLLNAGAKVDQQNKLGETPLMKVAHGGSNPDVARMLISAGANANTRNYSGDTPLIMVASRRGKTWHPDLIPTITHILIAAGADVNHTNNCGETPLILATYNGHVQMVHQLLDAGANIWLKATENGPNKKMANKDAITIARNKGRRTILERLEEFDRQIELFIKSIKEGNIDQVQQSISARPYLVNSPNRSGITPLICATKKGNFKICRFLLHKHALIHLNDNQGFTALDHASIHKQLEILELLQVYTKDTLKKRCLRLVIEANMAESAKIFADGVTETQLSLLPSFVEIVEVKNERCEHGGDTHENN